MLEHSDPSDDGVATEGRTAVAPDAAASASPATAIATIPDLSPVACAARLAELFPAVFSPGASKPLKLRIQADIQERAPGIFTRKALSGFLHRHTTSTAYLRALVNSPQRIDLTGAPAGEIATEHREAATVELQRRRTLHEARRAAEREAQRAAERETQRAERAAHDEAQRAHVAQIEERRERQALLRAFEASTLSRSNFCALKGVSEAELDALLAQARQEPLPPPVAPVAQARPPHQATPDRRPNRGANSAPASRANRGSRSP